jgi:mRNA interferase MazF
MSIGRTPVRPFARGDVHLVDFDPTRGSEQGGRRPAVIVSSEDMAAGSTVLVVPLTKTAPGGGGAPYSAPVAATQSGLDYDSHALCHQIRVVDKERLEQKIGRLAPEVMGAIDESLAYVLGLEPEPEF